MQIMGIVNVTPDSFSDGGQFDSAHAAVEHALRLVAEGAGIIDVGGESTRPNADAVNVDDELNTIVTYRVSQSNADAVNVDDELNRVLPVIDGIRKHNATIPISIDTYKASVAAAALDAGATMVNDISAGRFDDAMFPLIRARSVPYILMHMQGEPRTMQANPTYTDVVAEVKAFLRQRVDELGHTGAEVYVDPGIGFGKTTQHIQELLKNIDVLAAIAPLVLGLSRKRFLRDLVPINSIENLDRVTASIHALVMHKPIAMCRVHNVKALKEVQTLSMAL